MEQKDNKNQDSSSKQHAPKNEIVFEQILENIPYYVFWKDRNSNYLGCNQRFAEQAGFKSAKDLIGKNDYDACWTKAESDFFRAMDKKVMDANLPILNIEEPQKQLDGSTCTLLTSKVPLHNSKGEVIGILGIYTDISSRKNLEIEKDRALQDLKELQSQLIQNEKFRSLGEMAGGIAHEINNPLTVIKGSAAVLKKMLGSNKLDLNKALEVVDRIDKTATRISAIVKSLKSVSRNESPESLTNENLKDIITDVQSLSNEKLKDNLIDFSVVCKTPERQKFIRCNRVGLSQILLNLINNSVDAIANQEKPWIRLEVLEDDTDISIRIVDSGKGIDKSVVDKIFQPFYTTKQVGKGTGLGLSLSKSLAEKQGATLTYSFESENTCFIFKTKKAAIEINPAGEVA